MEGTSEVAVKITLREIYDLSLKTSGKVDVLLLKEDNNRTEIRSLKAEVIELQKARWPLPSVAIVLSMGALALTVIEKINGG